MLVLTRFPGARSGHWFTRLGDVLVVLGIGLLALAIGWQLGLVPGSRLSLPEPVAVTRAPAPTLALPEPGRPGGLTRAMPTLAPTVPTPAPTRMVPVLASIRTMPTLVPTSAPTSMPTPVPAGGPAFPPNFVSPDNPDREAEAPLPVPGYAVRLSIPSIDLDTPVEQGGVSVDGQGEPVWEMRPFVAVHYGDLTALVGARGNAVIAGHVVTRSEGNVFRLLYRVALGDDVLVWDDQGRLHAFQVVDVRLVSPSDTSVMEPTMDRTLTLITCGGTFDPIAREFSARLVVIAKPLMHDAPDDQPDSSS
ncbi:MAG: sortase [Chloroflexi bacterium]|nr:sortase [Chloroflexota bacterium]